MTCISLPNGIICIAKTEYTCPKCNHIHEGSQVAERLETSKRGYLFRTCQGCGERLVVASNIRGDLQAWLRVK